MDVKKFAVLVMPIILSSIACAQNDATSPRDRWGTEPLGPNVSVREWGPAPAKRPLQTRLQVLPASGARLRLIENGQARAAIIVADKPNAAAREGAAILQDTLQKISGAKLPIVSEKSLKVQGEGGARSTLVDGTATPFLIIVGDTDFGRAAGVHAADLGPEGYRIKTSGNALFVVGSDVGAGGVNVMGTRHAVFALLERHLGCRWLWPGENGTILPRRTTVELTPLDESDAPAIAQREIRNYYAVRKVVHERIQAGLRRLGKTDEEYLAQTAGSAAWSRAQRLGSSLNVNYKHAFEGWWDKYGAQHPEWFALQPNGSRTQTSRRERLDVTEPALIQAVAAQAIEQLKADPSLQAASVSPNDGGANQFCMCEVCRKMDPPNAPKIRMSFVKNKEPINIVYPSLSDRYVTFYAQVAEIVGKEMPDRWLGAYAYSYYRTPPLYAKLPPNVLVGFVGLTYVSDETLKRDRENWNGWAQSADKLMLRPNAFVRGHSFNLVYPHKLAEDIKHAYRTGMMAADFDSLMHNWAGQGLNYYVLAKLLWDPSQDVDAIIKDYCDSGFGAASQPVQKYFARLETLTSQIAAHGTNEAEGELREEEETQVRSHVKFWMHVPQYYTPTVLAELRALLDDAKNAAGDDEAIKERIDFLGAGLRYTEVQTAAFTALYGPEAPDKKARVMEALEARQRAYDDIFKNNFYAVNVTYPTWREENVWRRYGWDPLKKK